MNQLRKLMSAALVVRISDFIIYRVSTSQRKTVLKEFVMGKWGVAMARLAWNVRLLPFLSVSVSLSRSLALFLRLRVCVCVFLCSAFFWVLA